MTNKLSKLITLITRFQTYELVKMQNMDNIYFVHVNNKIRNTHIKTLKTQMKNF